MPRTDTPNPTTRSRRSHIATAAAVVAVALILAALWVNIAHTAGRWVALLLLGAGFGLAAVVGTVLGGAGYSVVHHAQREARAIAAIEASRARRELPR